MSRRSSIYDRYTERQARWDREDREECREDRERREEREDQQALAMRDRLAREIAAQLPRNEDLAAGRAAH